MLEFPFNITNFVSAQLRVTVNEISLFKMKQNQKTTKQTEPGKTLIPQVFLDRTLLRDCANDRPSEEVLTPRRGTSLTIHTPTL